MAAPLFMACLVLGPYIVTSCIAMDDHPLYMIRVRGHFSAVRSEPLEHFLRGRGGPLAPPGPFVVWYPEVLRAPWIRRVTLCSPTPM
jgi:hypothetical protein